MKNIKEKINSWEKEIQESHWEKEYRGIFESVLHLRTIIKYIRSEEAEKFLVEELGELEYKEQLRLQERNLKAREVELEVLKKTLLDKFGEK